MAQTVHHREGFGVGFVGGYQHRAGAAGIDHRRAATIRSLLPIDPGRTRREGLGDAYPAQTTLVTGRTRQNFRLWPKDCREFVAIYPKEEERESGNDDRHGDALWLEKEMEEHDINDN